MEYNSEENTGEFTAGNVVELISGSVKMVVEDSNEITTVCSYYNPVTGELVVSKQIPTKVLHLA